MRTFSHPHANKQTNKHTIMDITCRTIVGTTKNQIWRHKQPTANKQSPYWNEQSALSGVDVTGIPEAARDEGGWAADAPL